MTSDPPASRANPFSARSVRPGSISYHHPTASLPGRSQSEPVEETEETPLAHLLKRFESIGRTGQIVGPHGSGKSTLLADLIRLWKIAGERVVKVELHDGQRWLPINFSDVLSEEHPTLIAVDGYEQLAGGVQRALRRFCRRRGVGLVITTHRSMGIPDLARCAPSLALVTRLVHELLGEERDLVSDDDVRRSFRKHEGNVREVLFEMYDRYEQA